MPSGLALKITSNPENTRVETRLRTNIVAAFLSGSLFDSDPSALEDVVENVIEPDAHRNYIRFRISVQRMVPVIARPSTGTI